MKKEKIILSFIAASIGLLVAVVGFYLYQKTKSIAPSKVAKITAPSPSPSPLLTNFLTLENPKDESVLTNSTVKISGQTAPGAKLIILTAATQVSAVPTIDGHFSTDIGIDSGENLLTVIAIMPNGESITATRTVTYSTESF